MGIPCLIIGSYLCFLAGQFPNLTLFLFTTMAVSLAQLFSLYLFVLPNFSPSWTVPIVYIPALGMGLGLGYGAAKWPKIGIVVMGLSMGSLLGLLIYYLFMVASVNSTVAKVITVGGVALFSAIIYRVQYGKGI